jgi:hypothetical protein
MTTTIFDSNWSVVYGTVTNGINNSSWYQKDNNELNITEANGLNALEVNYTFNLTKYNVSTFNQIYIREYYLGSSTHNMDLQIWDYDTNSWESGYYTFQGQTGYVTWTVNVLDPEDHIQNGIVKIRLTHLQTGISSHKLSIDWLVLVKGVSAGSYNDDDTGYLDLTARRQLIGNLTFSVGNGLNYSYILNAPAAGGSDGTGGWTNSSTETNTSLQVNAYKTTPPSLWVGNSTYAGQGQFAGRFYNGLLTVVHHYNMTSTVPELDQPRKAAIQILGDNSSASTSNYQKEMIIGIDADGASPSGGANNPTGYIQVRQTAINSGELALQPWGGSVSMYKYSTGTLLLNGYPIGGLGFYGIDSGYTNYLALGDTGKGYCGSYGMRTNDAGKFQLTLGAACIDQQTMTCDTASKCAFGTDTPTNRLSVESTTSPQFRVSYNTANYTTFATGSDGTLTMDSVGTTPSFYFSDNVGINMAPGTTQKLAVRYDSANGASGYGARIRQIATGTGFVGGSVFGTYNELDMSGNATYSSYQSALLNTVNMANTYPTATHYVRGADQRITVAYGTAEATGLYNYIIHNAENVASTSLNGEDSFIQIAKGNVGTSTGIKISASYVHAGVNLTTGQGLYIDTVENSSTGKITNHYSIRGRSTLEATNNYFILSDDGQSVFNENGENRSDFRVESDTQANMLFVDSETNTVGIGSTAGTYPLTVGFNASGISIYSEGNISATGYITRTSDWDKNKDSQEYYFENKRLTNGKINHTAYGVNVLNIKDKKLIGYSNKTFEDTESSIIFENITREVYEDYYENVTTEVTETRINDSLAKIKEEEIRNGIFSNMTVTYEVKTYVTKEVKKERLVNKTISQPKTVVTLINKTIQEPIYEDIYVEGVLLDDVVAKHDDTLSKFTGAIRIQNETNVIKVKADKTLDVDNYVSANGYVTKGQDYSEIMKKQNISENMTNGDVICIGINNTITKKTTTGTCIKFAVVSGSDAGVVSGNITSISYFIGNKMKIKDDFTNSSVALVSFIGQKKIKVYGTCTAGNWLIPSGRNDGTASCIDFKASGNAGAIVNAVASKIGISSEDKSGTTTTTYLNALISGGW